MLIKTGAVLTAIRLALHNSVLNQTYHTLSCLAFLLHTFGFCLFGEIHSNLTNIYIYVLWYTKQLLEIEYVSVDRTLPHILEITEKITKLCSKMRKWQILP